LFSFFFAFLSDSLFSFLPSAVVCDFGLARVTTFAATLDGMKFSDIRGFSPRYAAPEVLANAALQMTGDPEADKKSDVYSFAIIIWELITRAIPWGGLTLEQIDANVRSGQRVPLLLFSFLFFPSLSQLHFSLFGLSKPPLSEDSVRADPAGVIMVELARSCWHDNPASRPPFDQISAKIISLL